MVIIRNDNYSNLLCFEALVHFTMSQKSCYQKWVNKVGDQKTCTEKLNIMNKKM